MPREQPTDPSRSRLAGIAGACADGETRRSFAVVSSGGDLRSLWIDLVHRDALTLVPRDGRSCIDSNAAERSMRPMGPGLRESDSGGDRAAAIYTLTETANLHGLDPEDYLRKVLTCIGDHPVRRVYELLPWNMADIRQRLDQREAA